MPPSRRKPAEAGIDDAERCLHQVWEHLTARGFLVDEPGVYCQCFYRNLGGACCEMDLLVTGALVWIYMPPPSGFGPGQAARLVLGLLTGTTHPGSALPAAPDPGLALKDTAGRILAASGMPTRLVQIRYSATETSEQVEVTSPAGQARGHVRISDTEIRWECRFATHGSPAPGLAPRDIAESIAAALAAQSVISR